MPVSQPVDVLSPVVTTVSALPDPDADNLPTVTVRASFDWKFWAGLALAGCLLLGSHRAPPWIGAK